MSEGVRGRAAIVYSKGAAAIVQGGCEEWLPTCRGALDAVPIEYQATHVVFFMGFTGHELAVNDMTYHQSSSIDATTPNIAQRSSLHGAWADHERYNISPSGFN